MAVKKVEFTITYVGNIDAGNFSDALLAETLFLINKHSDNWSVFDVADLDITDMKVEIAGKSFTHSS